jgi:hypothetical protein
VGLHDKDCPWQQKPCARLPGCKSLRILTPMYGGICYINYFHSVHQLFIESWKHQVPISFEVTYNESLICRARNRLCDAYMKTGQETHAVFIDADIGFEWGDIFHMLELDLDIIGAPCAKKELRWDRVQKILKKNGNGAISNSDLSKVTGSFVVNFERFTGKKDINLVEPQEVVTIGTGLMMIRRNVFDKFMEAYPDRWYQSLGDSSSLPGPTHEFFRSGIDRDSNEYLSEDYFFCVDCKNIGFKTWMLPCVKTTHLGTYTFVGDMPAIARLAGELF